MAQFTGQFVVQVDEKASGLVYFLVPAILDDENKIIATAKCGNMVENPDSVQDYAKSASDLYDAVPVTVQGTCDTVGADGGPSAYGEVTVTSVTPIG